MHLKKTASLHEIAAVKVSSSTRKVSSLKLPPRKKAKLDQLSKYLETKSSSESITSFATASTKKIIQTNGKKVRSAAPKPIVPTRKEA